MMQGLASHLRLWFFSVITLASVALFPVSDARANCATNPATPATFGFSVISHDTGNSFCELCGTSEIHIVLRNEDSQQLTNLSVTEDLTGSGLEYVPGTTSINGSPAVPANDPSYVNPAQTLTWSAAQLPDLAGAPGPIATTYEIVFQVRAVGIAENLVSASRVVNASASFDFQRCDLTYWPRATHSTGAQTIPIVEPLPVITKNGRNVDAGQGGYTPDVYGNEEDDVIWQLNIANGGAVAMQDLKFNDLMAGTNMTVNYACPTQGAAVAVATNDGVDPSPATSGCLDSSDGIGNNISDFVVTDPFGAAGSPQDVNATSAIQIYLVGKLNSACSLETNTAGSLEWGCAVNAPAGGIAASATSGTPADATATVSNFVDNSQLNITQAVTGLNAGEDVGARGLVTITVDNNTGGTVKNIHLRDVLPANYVVDPTFTPTINWTYAYGNSYSGAINAVTWTNPAGGTPAASLASEANFLANTAPEFDLTSPPLPVTAPHPDQFNMLRHGDSVTITFRIVLINSTYYDQAADLDVTPETGPATDPSAMAALSNTVEATFEKFCSGATPTVTNTDNAIPVDPEDIDI
ncbi:MAG: hypothetical protein LJE56_08430, partial [Acidiferrobacterales bacterium]|nr:hypothetical protein [Acidiferrobacterales bacterium]